ncbi:hypothetical protein [Glaesserella sp.]|uniref:hypothetical protein n=1 Tax=Glaesserella sp. TaxID=2094731 RepID=UPI00359FEA8E
MKVSAKFSLTLLSAVILTACSSGGSSGAKPPSQSGKVDQPKVQQPEAPKVKQPEAPKVEQPEAPKVEQPEAPKVEQPEAPKVEQPEAPKVKQPEAPKVEQPEAPKVEQPEVPKVEQPEVPKVELPEIKTNYQTFGKAQFNQETQTINLYTFKRREGEDTFDKHGNLILEDKQQIVLPLSEINTLIQHKDYEIYPLADNIFYGHYSDSPSDYTINADDRYRQYFALVDENRISKSIPADLTATYHKADGFIYGAIPHNNDYVARIVKKGDVNLQFEGGVATGNIIDKNVGDAPVFTLKGTINRLEIQATENNEIIQAHLEGSGTQYTPGMDKAIMDIKFIDSAPDANDKKFIIGYAENDRWSGILVGEKK